MVDREVMRANLLRFGTAFSFLLCCGPDIESSRCEGSVMIGGLSPVDCAPLHAECVDTPLVVECVRRPVDEGCMRLYQCGFSLQLEGVEKTEAECVGELALLEEEVEECDGACMALVEDCDEEAFAACLRTPCGALPERIEAPPAPAPAPAPNNVDRMRGWRQGWRQRWRRMLRHLSKWEAVWR
jgi:hypothetical protein